ncbi:hypothetical protein DSL72_007062, partial [Monilinia vaccinii-corymbosi]
DVEVGGLQRTLDVKETEFQKEVEELLCSSKTVSASSVNCHRFSIEKDGESCGLVTIALESLDYIFETCGFDLIFWHLLQR